MDYVMGKNDYIECRHKKATHAHRRKKPKIITMKANH